MKTNIAIFADDGSIIERSIDEMGRTFEILTEIRENYGRSLNKMKSKIMIFNERERREEVAGVAVVEEMGYLVQS